MLELVKQVEQEVEEWEVGVVCVLILWEGSFLLGKEEVYVEKVKILKSVYLRIIDYFKILD